MNPARTITTHLSLFLLLATAMAGCLDGDDSDADEPAQTTLADTTFMAPRVLAGPVAAEDITWPDFTGETLRILDHGAFFAFGKAARQFQNLTGAKVVHKAADDTGGALNLAVQQAGDPDYDVLYGIDNSLLWQAVQEGIFQSYRPQLAGRVDIDLLFFRDALGALAPWPATPVDHGYIAINYDPGHDAMDGVTVGSLDDLATNATLFVTPDPRTSTPGLGFLLTTIAAYGENTPYNWQSYWNDLFNEGVLITSGWTEAYETHFSGGYGQYGTGHIGDRPIVTSYTESPAYEAYFGATTIPEVLLEHQAGPASFHQIQTMGILAGTPRLALAQAWIEYSLTADFQAFAASENAVYPVDPDLDTDGVYGDHDPEPGTFESVDMDWVRIGDDLAGWLLEWTDLCEAHGCI